MIIDNILEDKNRQLSIRSMLLSPSEPPPINNKRCVKDREEKFIKTREIAIMCAFYFSPFTIAVNEVFNYSAN